MAYIGNDPKKNDSVGTAQIADNAITNAKLADDAIDSADLADASVDLAHMSANSVDSDQYVDLSIDNAHIATGLDTVKLADGSITNTELQYINTLSSNAQTQISAKLPLAGGAMTGAITTNSTFDGVDIATRDAILTSTTTTAGAALPKAGGAMTGAITTNSTFDGIDIATRDGVLSSTTTTANAALPKAGGAMTGAITTNSTFDGVDIATRDGVLTSTTTTANAALPKAGGTMTGDLTIDKTTPLLLMKADADATTEINFYDGSTRIADISANGTNNELVIDARSGHSLELRGGGTANSLYIAGSGKVGIGTASPDELLHIEGTSAYVQIESTATNGTAGISIQNDARNWVLRTNGGDGDKFQIRDATANAQRMEIDSSGNATFAGTIGSGAITSTAGISGTTGTFTGVLTVQPSSGDANAYIKAAGSATLFLNTTGTTDHCKINFGDSADDNEGIIQYNNTGDSMTFHTNATLAMTLGSDQSATFGGDVIVTGDLTINGTTTTINSTTLSVDDKNIELGSVATPSDTTADGGGITLKGASDKTILWTNATDTWDFNQGIKVTGAITSTAGLTATTGTFTGLIKSTSTSEQIRAYYDSNTFASFSSRSDDNVQIYGWDGSSYQDILLAVDGSTTAAGKVGIGTASPSQLLHIESTGDVTGLVKTSSTSSAAAWLQVEHGSAGTFIFGQEHGSGGGLVTGDSANAGIISKNGNNPVQLATNGSVRMTILGDGNVGIGTMNPGGLLDIAGAASTAKPAFLRLSNAGAAAYYWDMWRDNTTGYLNLGSATGGSFTTHLTIKDVTGYVGINNTNPTSPFVVGNGAAGAFNVQLNNGVGGGWGTLIKAGLNSGDYVLELRNENDVQLFKMMADSTATFAGNINVATGDTPKINITESGGSSLDIYSGGGGSAIWTTNAKTLSIGTNGTASITIDTSQNATFTGGIQANGGFERSLDQNAGTAMTLSNPNAGTGAYAEMYIKNSDKQLIVGYSKNYSGVEWQGGWIYPNAGSMMVKSYADVEIFSGGLGDANRALILDSSMNATFAGDIAAAGYIKSDGLYNNLDTKTNKTLTDQGWLEQSAVGTTAASTTYEIFNIKSDETYQWKYAEVSVYLGVYTGGYLGWSGTAFLSSGTSTSNTTSLTPQYNLEQFSHSSGQGALSVYDDNGVIRVYFTTGTWHASNLLTVKVKIHHTKDVIYNLFSTGVTGSQAGNVITPTNIFAKQVENIGIGTANPNGTLHVNKVNNYANFQLTRDDSTISDTDYLGIIFFGGTENSGTSFDEGAKIVASAAQDWAIGSAVGTDLSFWTAPIGSSTPLERLTINDSGNVGIGDSSPAVKLHVKHNTTNYVAKVHNEGGADDSHGLLVETDSTNTAANIFAAQSSGGSFYIKSGGNVGIGTSGNAVGGQPGNTTGLLNLYKTGTMSGKWMQQIRADSSTGNGLFIRAGVTSSYYTAYFTGYDEANVHFVVRGDGKVGIGTGSPTSGLHIKGATGNMQLESSTVTNVVNFQFVNGGGTSRLGLENNNGGGLAVGGLGYAMVMGPVWAGALQLMTNETARLTIRETTGRVGIGTTGPDSLLHVYSPSSTSFAGYTTTFQNLNESNNYANIVYIHGGNGASDALLRCDTRTNGTALAVVGTAQVGVGCADPDGTFEVRDGQSQFRANGANTNPMIIQNTYTSAGDQVHVNMYRGSSIVGAIRTTTSSTSYITSSDYRLKENETPMVGSINKLKQLKPYGFNFKVDPDNEVSGFFAHEVSSIVSEAVSGEKDAVDENDEMIPQGIDQSKLVPLLVSALQEAIERIEVLENE